MTCPCGCHSFCINGTGCPKSTAQRRRIELRQSENQFGVVVQNNLPAGMVYIHAEARRLFDKQRATPHGEMMPAWENLTISVRQAWLNQAERRLTRKDLK
jgi:hypothetical protein